MSDVGLPQRVKVQRVKESLVWGRVVSTSCSDSFPFGRLENWHSGVFVTCASPPCLKGVAGKRMRLGEGDVHFCFDP